MDRVKELIERGNQQFVKDDLIYMLILLENGENAEMIINNSSSVTVPEIRQMIRIKMYGKLLNRSDWLVINFFIRCYIYRWSLKYIIHYLH